MADEKQKIYLFLMYFDLFSEIMTMIEEIKQKNKQEKRLLFQ